ncbi:MAG: ATP-binding cassette domain-containing protein [Alphaproteobacteria bacterium GM7ARS4]|nr:ATP-binding cassette domain-containing protein [Alphaproteobacteria bacterium GM7ARS4]
MQPSPSSPYEATRLPGSPSLEESETKPVSWRPLGRLLAMTLRYWGRLIAASVALIVAASLVLGINFVIKHFVDGNLISETTSFAITLTWVFIFMAAIGVSSSLRLYFVGWIGERVVADLRSSVYRHIITQSPSFFELNHSGAILSRLTTDSGIIQTLIGSTASVAIRHVVILVGAALLLFFQNWRLASVTLTLAPITVLLLFSIGRKVRTLSRHSQDRIADMSAYAEESLRGIRTLQAYNRQNVDTQRFDDHVESTFSTATSRLRMRALMITMVMIGIFIVISAIIHVGHQEIIAQRLSLGELVGFLYLALLAGGSTAALTESFSEILRAAGAAERIFEIKDSHIDIRSPENPVPLSTSPQDTTEITEGIRYSSPPPGHDTPQQEYTIEFDGVSFTYPSGKGIAALSDVSFHIDHHETVAIVGPSGAGKSTLFQLLLRFYDPQTGCVRLCGKDIRTLDLKVLRQCYAFVSQDPIIFAASARENIAYARQDASIEEIRDAAKDAAILDVIDEFPQGFDSYLGQGGILLSGGERQRIALARAFLSKPMILLLDEATSALDSEREKRIQEAIYKIAGQCTSLIIAHRLSTVMHADRILVLDRGGLIAQGTHKELMQSCDLYARLAEIQFASQPHP